MRMSSPADTKVQRRNSASEKERRQEHKCTLIFCNNRFWRSFCLEKNSTLTCLGVRICLGGRGRSVALPWESEGVSAGALASGMMLEP